MTRGAHLPVLDSHSKHNGFQAVLPTVSRDGWRLQRQHHQEATVNGCKRLGAMLPALRHQKSISAHDHRFCKRAITRHAHYSLSRPPGQIFCVRSLFGNTIGTDPEGSLADHPRRPFHHTSREGPRGVAAGDGSPRQATDGGMPGQAPRLRNVVVAPADGAQPTLETPPE